MITTEQEKWLNHLSDQTKISIVDFDPTSQEKFEAVRSIIQAKIGNSVEVLHCGASSMGISGQDEIDVYVPVPAKLFDNLVEQMTDLFGSPRSHYPQERARFVTDQSGKHIDVFVINKENDGWKNSVIFESYLRKNPKVLRSYRELKEAGNGLSVREYYRRKIEFINSIIEKYEKDV